MISILLTLIFENPLDVGYKKTSSSHGTRKRNIEKQVQIIFTIWFLNTDKVNII